MEFVKNDKESERYLNGFITTSNICDVNKNAKVGKHMVQMVCWPLAINILRHDVGSLTPMLYS